MQSPLPEQEQQAGSIIKLEEEEEEKLRDAQDSNVFRLVSYSQNQESESVLKTGPSVVPDYVDYWIKKAGEEGAHEDAGFGQKKKIDKKEKEETARKHANQYVSFLTKEAYNHVNQ